MVGGAAAVRVLEGQHTLLPEEPSTTERCQVARHTAQCDREEMLLADVLHGVNTFPLGQICLVFFRF